MAKLVEQPTDPRATPSPAPDSGHPGESRYLTAVDDIVRALNRFRDERLPLTLRFSETEICKAMVVDVTPDHLVLEDLKPRPLIPLMQSGRAFSVSGRGEGVFCYVESLHCKKIVTASGLPVFYLERPRSMLFQQRRRAKRVSLPARFKTSGARIELHRGELVIGQLLDISVGGCRAELISPPSRPLAINEEIKQCKLSIRRLLELQTPAVVRHSSFDKRSGRVQCGLEFVGMDTMERLRLERFIQRLLRSV